MGDPQARQLTELAIHLANLDAAFEAYGLNYGGVTKLA
jgi:hypothetical protein